MKKVCFVMATALTVFLAQVEASMIVDFAGIPLSANQSATFSSLDGSVASSNEDMVPSGSLSASDIGSGETFAVTVSGVSNWNYAAVSSAGSISGLGGPLAYVSIDGNNAGWGVAGGGISVNDLDLTTEALVVSFNLGNLTAAHQSEFRLQGFGMGLGRWDDGVDAFNYTILNSSGVVTASASGQSNAILAALDIALNDGGSLVIGHETGSFRFNDFTVDVIPEPATLGLVLMAGAGLLGIRRRVFMR